MAKEEQKEEQKCEDCKYFKYTQLEGREPKAFGQCHKHAPRASSPQIRNKKEPYKYARGTCWPIVRSNSFCGEFEQKKQIPTDMGADLPEVEDEGWDEWRD